MHLYYPVPSNTPNTGSADATSAKTNLNEAQAHNYSINAKIYFRLGCATMQLGYYDDAVKDLQTALYYQTISYDLTVIINNANGTPLPTKDLSISKKLQDVLKLRDAEKKREGKKYAGMFK